MISAGRTGTKFLGTQLNKFDKIVAFHEPAPNFQKEGSRYFRWKHRNFKNTRIRHHLPLGSYYRLKFKISRWRLSSSSSKPIYLEANGYLTAFLPALVRAFPDADVIHLVRHPGSWIRSSLSIGNFLYRETDPTILPFRTGEMTREQWFQMHPVDSANWFWNTYNDRIDSIDPDLTLSFRSIFSGDHRGFDRLLKFLGVNSEYPDDFFDANVNQSHDVIPAFEDWPKAWKAKISDSIEKYHKKYQKEEEHERMG